MRYFWIGAFCFVLLALAFGPALFSHERKADEELKIISPHWDGIRQEFGRAFEEDYFKRTGRRVHVEWLDIGGTEEIRKYLDERFGQVGPDEGVGADILFGGGGDLLPDMAKKNYFEPYQLSDEQKALLPERVGGPAPAWLPLPFFFIPFNAQLALTAFGGQQLRDPRSRYFAACMSSFGIVYNTQVIRIANLPEPKIWQDLARPEFQGWVTCGYPASGSVHAAFEIILQAQGWERGNSTLIRMISNVRAFNEGGSSVPRDVSLGQAAAGPSIDFYASAPVRRQGAAHIKLVIPASEAISTPDGIAILRQPPNREAARAFMQFVLGEDGQKLWYVARGEPGGPKDYDLERLPVMPSIYNRGLKTLTLTNPFKSAAGVHYDSGKAGTRWSTLNDLWRATLIDVHDDLWDARTAILKAGRDGDLGLELGRAPMAEQDLLAIARKKLPADERNALRNKWSAWARKRYADLERAARSPGSAVPAFAPAPTE